MKYCFSYGSRTQIAASSKSSQAARAEPDMIREPTDAQREERGDTCMVKVVYEVVPHDGGWAYKLGDVYSEAFPSHSEALEAARIVAAEQQVGGYFAEISWQDAQGKWHEEYAEG